MARASVTSTGSSYDAVHLKENIAAFFNDYRRAVEAMNAEAMSSFYSYPVLLTDEANQRVLETAADYVSAVAPTVGSWRELGVASVNALDLEVVPVASSLAVAVVDWEALGKDDQPLYSFRALYTLIRKEAWRITAIAFNERPNLRAALRARRDAQGQGAKGRPSGTL
jgi:ketosteroid isomerase-like protein